MIQFKEFIKVFIIIFVIISFKTLSCICEEKNDGLRIIGHRGASGFAPENTLEAFYMAADIGMWGIESDLYVLDDGNMIMFHDSKVERMTDGAGKIANKNLKEVKKLNIDSGSNINKYSEVKIPTFDEYLKCCNELDLVPVIEFKNIKANNVKSIVNKIKKMDLEEKAIIISRDFRAIKYIRKYSEKIHFQYLEDITEKNLAVIERYGNFGMDIKDSQVSVEKVKLAKSHGAIVNVWGVKTMERYLELKSMGVDMITSDFIF